MCFREGGRQRASSWFLSHQPSSPQTCRTGPLTGPTPTHHTWLLHEIKPGCVGGGGVWHMKEEMSEMKLSREDTEKGPLLLPHSPFSAHCFLDLFLLTHVHHLPLQLSPGSRRPQAAGACGWALWWAVGTGGMDSAAGSPRGRSHH